MENAIFSIFVLYAKPGWNAILRL